MTPDELIISYAVKINGGSGVLVGALSQDYTYVFTAKHVLSATNQVTRSGVPLQIIDEPYLHPKLDCAVIKVEFQQNVKQRNWLGNVPTGAVLSFVGFPDTNTNTDIPYKIYTGVQNSTLNNVVVCNLNNSPAQDAIVGMSGGGLYHVYNGYPYLVGVESRMDDEDEHLRWGRIRCFSMAIFEEIIAQHDLALIAPSFMTCFSQLKDDIFYFNAANPDNVVKLHKKLHEYADTVIALGLPPPHELMTRYNKKLLVGHETQAAVLDRDLWVAYFEFVIVCALIDGPNNIDEDYIKDLEKRRRFVYSGSNAHWIRHLSEILKAAKSTLDEHGVMIISSPQEEAPCLPDEEDLEEVIDDIASAPTVGTGGRIDDVHSEVYKTYTVAHMKGLRNKYVLKKHREYGLARPSEQLKIFRDYYNEVIK
ncbi:ABC-three component system protein [Aeromonas veronii]